MRSVTTQVIHRCQHLPPTSRVNAPRILNNRAVLKSLITRSLQFTPQTPQHVIREGELKEASEAGHPGCARCSIHGGAGSDSTATNELAACGKGCVGGLDCEHICSLGSIVILRTDFCATFFESVTSVVICCGVLDTILRTRLQVKLSHNQRPLHSIGQDELRARLRQ
jgi:hypothetical protein